MSSFREELTDFIYRLLLTVCIAVFIFFEYYNFYDPELITRKNIISLLLISFSFNVLLIIYHKIRLYIIPAILLVATVFVSVTDSEDINIILNSVLFQLLIIGLIAFIVFLTSDTSAAVNLILSAGVILYMFILLFRDIEIYPASPAPALFYIAFSCTRIFRQKKDRIAARTRSYITYLLPFLLIIPIGIFLLPKPDEPISWNWAKELYQATVDKINELAHEISLRLASDEDDGNEIEFGFEDSMTYDNSDRDDTAVMEVRLESRLYGSCYLNGEIFNVFSDGKWHNTLDSDVDYSAIDGLETFYGMINFDRDSINDIIKNTTLNIKFLDLTSRMLFSPAKITPSYSYKNSVDVKTTPVNEHILFDRKRTYGTEYTIDFFQLNYGSAPFMDYMNSNLTDSEEAMQTAKQVYLRSDYKSTDLNDINEYRSYVYQNYTSKPQVRDSVKNWVQEVTEGCTTDYEKLKAIEYMLSSYEYSMENGGLPDYVNTEGDFLDYFLLSSRSGYCVHYATAFCLLARYMGFPARVIQGYKAPYSKERVITVMNSYGHSWPEVYFKGKGWIAFEPTPGFGAERYGSWMIYSGKYSNVNEPDYSYLQTQPDASITAEDEEYMKQHSEKRVSGMLILIVISIVVISLILLVTVTAIANHVKRKRLSPEKLYSQEFRVILNILKELKITKNKDETLEEFLAKCIRELQKITKPKPADEVTDSSDDAAKSESYIMKTDTERFTSMIKTYEKFIYGRLELSDNEMNEIANVKDRLLLMMKHIYRSTYPLHRLKLYIAGSVHE